jgi:hypothetical protein
MPTKWTALLILGMLFVSGVCCAQQKTTHELILSVDETASGPFGGEKSSSCLRVYSDGKVRYARWWNEAVTIVDEAGRKSRPEHTISLEYDLEDGSALELSTFFKSKPLRRLPEKFGPPHRPVDYVEITSVQIRLAKGKSKHISAREFYVADLEEKARYPAALIVLMDKIDEIEKQTSNNGKPAETPPDCQLRPESH